MKVKYRVISQILVFIYILVIVLSFERICSIFSTVQGYQCESSSIFLYIFNGLLLVALSSILPVTDKRVSSVFAWLLFYFHVTPSVLFFSSITGANFFESMVFIVPVLISCTFLFMVSRAKLLTILFVRIPGRVLDLSIIFIFLAFSVLIVQNLGLKLDAPSITDVYGVRADYKKSVSNLVSYIVVLSGFFLSPVLIVLGIYKFGQNQRCLAALFFFMSFSLSYLIFSSAGFKSIAFMPLVTFFGCLFFLKVRYFGLALNFAFLGLLVFSWTLIFLFDFGIVLDHWVRRSLVVPGMNVAYFYEYIDFNGVSRDIHYPSVISKTYYGTDGSANSGFIGDGVSRFGTGFFWINILLVLFYVKIPDVFSRRYASPYIAALFISSAYALSNSSITTVLITYGFIPLVIFCLLFQRSFK